MLHWYYKEGLSKAECGKCGQSGYAMCRAQTLTCKLDSAVQVAMHEGS